jgi:hypothetical protein
MTEVFHFLPQSLLANAELVLRLGHYGLLPNPFRFIIHQSHYQLSPYSLSTDSDVKQFMREDSAMSIYKMKLPLWGVEVQLHYS